MNDLQRARRRLALSALVTLGSAAAVWYVLYPLAGYSQETLAAAQLATAAIGAGGIALWRLGWKNVGLGVDALGQAAIVGATVMAVFLVLGLTLGSILAPEIPVLRPGISIWLLLDNWVLTGLGEEILFCGLLFNLTLRAVPARHRWVAVPLVALIFAAWHLPGYLARDLPLAGAGGRLALNFASWIFFGLAYRLSGNLWLAAFMHANTNYSLSPLVVASPPLGLIFMGMMVLASWFVGRKRSLVLGEPFPCSRGRAS